MTDRDAGPVKKNTGKNTATRNARGQIVRGGNPGNSGGKKGRSGRKTLAFAAECEGLVDTHVLTKVRRYLRSTRGPNDPAWRWCAEYVTNYGKGKPAQTVQVTGEDGGPMRFTLALGEVPLD